ncbi:hypothetical protein BDQ17DRAFT_1099712 [Cyathus striatus]|nr:hypothetical protein BDQ17DRAFT_1099712 [Cyathus striatus]
MTCHHDGWVTDKNGNLLFWVPDYLRSILCDFDTIVIMGKTTVCRLSLSQFCHGSDWKIVLPLTQETFSKPKS